MWGKPSRNATMLALGKLRGHALGQGFSTDSKQGTTTLTKKQPGDHCCTGWGYGCGVGGKKLKSNNGC